MNMADEIRKRIIIGDDRDPLFPVQAFFNSIGDSSFVSIVSSLVKRIGYCTDYTCCNFPSNLDPGEEVFEGVRFSLFEDVAIIDNKSFLNYLELVCNEHIKFCPDDEEEIIKLLKSNFII
jgi:CDI immunity protein